MIFSYYKQINTYIILKTNLITTHPFLKLLLFCINSNMNNFLITLKTLKKSLNSL